jgi:hypothetical protein
MRRTSINNNGGHHDRHTGQRRSPKERRNHMELGGMQQISSSGASTAGAIGSGGMQDIMGLQGQQMKFQTEMGQLQLMVKMNEALAKIMKAIGTVIAQLAP